MTFDERKMKLAEIVGTPARYKENMFCISYYFYLRKRCAKWVSYELTINQKLQ